MYMAEYILLLPLAISCSPVTLIELDIIKTINLLYTHYIYMGLSTNDVTPSEGKGSSNRDSDKEDIRSDNTHIDKCSKKCDNGGKE